MKPILIAEDEPADIEVAKRALRKASVLNSLFSVRDGSEVIAYLQGQGIYANRTLYAYPEILLLDLKMPRMSGVEVLEWIRSHPEHAKLAVIVLTGSGNVREINQAYRLGAHSFLIKPVDMSELLNLLTDLKGIRLKTHELGRYLEYDPACIK